MAIEIKGKGSPVGDGTMHPNNSLENAEIQQLIFAYKRSVASKYSGVTEDSINGDIVPGKYWVSPKIDGQLWFLIAQDGDVVLANPRGRVLSGKLPLLAEAKKTVGKKASDCTVIAGELFAIGPRPRVGDITSLLSENGDVRKIAFSAFDLLQGGNLETVPEDYGERHTILEDCCATNEPD